MKKDNAVNLLKVICIVFLIIGVIMIGIGFQKHKVYKNPNNDYISNNNSVNAYVGGDAYNYIINGTYFTAYSVLGVGALIIATITGVGALFMLVEKNDGIEVNKGNVSTLQDIESNLPSI